MTTHFFQFDAAVTNHTSHLQNKYDIYIRADFHVYLSKIIKNRYF